MLFIWRGIGIAVPVVFFAVGYIVSFWFKDTRLGNPDYVGWVCFYSAIVCALLGVAAFGIGKPKKQEDGSFSARKKHDFFFIPIIFWAPILGAVAAWMFFGTGKSNKLEEMAKKAPATDTVRMLHFYNPTEDTVFYVLSDEHGYFEKEKLKPFSSVERLAYNSSYLLAGIDLEGKSTIAFPDNKKEFDSTKYVKMKEGDSYIYQRIISPVTKETNDYEDAWVLLDRRYDLAVININDLYENNNLQKNKIGNIDWMKKIHSKHTGGELIEPRVLPASGEEKPWVVNPNTQLPLNYTGKRSMYVLMAYPYDAELSDEFIAERISWLIK